MLISALGGMLPLVRRAGGGRPDRNDAAGRFIIIASSFKRPLAAESALAPACCNGAFMPRFFFHTETDTRSLTLKALNASITCRRDAKRSELADRS